MAKDRTKDFDELVRQMSRGQDKTAASNYRYDERDVAAKEAARESTAREAGHGRTATPPAVQEKAAGVGAAREPERPANPEKELWEQPQRPAGQRQTQGAERNAAGRAALPDSEAFKRGAQIDQVERLGQKPGKTAARLRGAFAKSTGGLDYMRSLEAEGFHLARIDGNDARASVQRREDAEAAKLPRMPRVFREGELVAINRYGTAYRIDAYSTGAKRAAIDAKVAGIDRGTVSNLETAYFKARVAGVERAVSRGADLDQWRQQVNHARVIEAAKDRGKARGETFGRAMGNARAAAAGIGYAMRVLDGLASTIEGMTLSPEVKAERKAEDIARREAQPSRQELRNMELMEAYRRDQDDKTKRRGDLAAQFDKQLEADREPGGGRELKIDKGSGSR